MRFEPVLRRILVPTDGTTGSQPALQIGGVISKAFKSRVTVIHSIASELAALEEQYTWQVTRGTSTGLPAEGSTRPAKLLTAESMKAYDELESQIYQRSQKTLAQAISFFKREGVTVDEKLVEDADPATAIMKQAHEGAYDLIVMGRREDDGEEPHLGSVAQKVARHSKIPVLVAGSASGRISKILIAFDGSQDAEKALQYGAYLAKNIGAKMTVVHVLHMELGIHKAEQDREGGNRILARASDILEDIDLDKKEGSGDPAKFITQMAQQETYDLIVMGSRGHSNAERFLLGSVSEHIIHYTDKSVLIVR
ncbi:MAG TPA: universal stress protein [Candidatus Bathyarchaeia archaeon]|nr:universal stress protein [Candidatus Bathyarchaeia archaeon]